MVKKAMKGVNAWDSDEGQLVTLEFPFYASPKLDGIRATIQGGVSLSYSGNPTRNKYIQSIIGHELLEGFDGELCVGSPYAPDVYNKTSSGVMSGDGEPDFKYYLFDDMHDPNATFITRMTGLRHRAVEVNNFFIGKYGREFVEVLDQVWVENEEELQAAEVYWLTLGYEGVMLRKPEGKYKFGRSTLRESLLLKVKRFSHDEAEIVGFKELMHNDNEAELDVFGKTKRSTSKEGLVAAGSLGAYICKSPDYEETFDVSCGTMKKDERIEAWNNREAALGKICRYKHFPHGAKDRPRHPLYAGLRDPDDM